MLIIPQHMRAVDLLPLTAGGALSIPAVCMIGAGIIGHAGAVLIPNLIPNRMNEYSQTVLQHLQELLNSGELDQFPMQERLQQFLARIDAHRVSSFSIFYIRNLSTAFIVIGTRLCALSYRTVKRGLHL